MALNDLILAAVVRIGTNPRLFDPCPRVETDRGFARFPGLRWRNLIA